MQAMIRTAPSHAEQVSMSMPNDGLDSNALIAYRIGHMSQGFTLYDRFSVKENLTFAARIRDDMF